MVELENCRQDGWCSRNRVMPLNRRMPGQHCSKLKPRLVRIMNTSTSALVDNGSRCFSRLCNTHRTTSCVNDWRRTSEFELACIMCSSLRITKTTCMIECQIRMLERNVRVCYKYYVSIGLNICHGGNHSKKSNFLLPPTWITSYLPH